MLGSATWLHKIFTISQGVLLWFFNEFSSIWTIQMDSWRGGGRFLKMRFVMVSVGWEVTMEKAVCRAQAGGIHNQRRRIKELGEEYGKDITKETEGKNPNKRRWRIKLGELLLFPPSVLTPPLHLLVGKRTQRFRLLDGSRRFFNHLYLLLNNSMGRQGEVGSDSQRFQQIVQ